MPDPFVRLNNALATLQLVDKVLQLTDLAAAITALILAWAAKGGDISLACDDWSNIMIAIADCEPIEGDERIAFAQSIIDHTTHDISALAARL